MNQSTKRTVSTRKINDEIMKKYKQSKLISNFKLVTTEVSHIKDQTQCSLVAEVNCLSSVFNYSQAGMNIEENQTTSKLS